jgi:two-component system response regulator YesN
MSSLRYKVLLVDDEKLSRDSISSLIDWEEHNLQLVGAARNGFEALEIVTEEMPDVIITDIEMPVMNGLEFITRAKKISPNAVFVVLSGYGEYDYTSEAMRQGVRHYLLKPCNEITILKVIEEIKQELLDKSAEQEFFMNLKRNFQKVLPQVKEQFLRDVALTGVYNKQDFDSFMKMFDIHVHKFQLVLVQFGEDCGYLEKFALKNIAEEVLTQERLHLSTVIEDGVLLLVQAIPFEVLSTLLNKIKMVYESYYRIELFIAVSDDGGFERIRLMYKEAQGYLRFRFYFSEGCILTKQDVQMGVKQHLDYSALFEDIASSVKAGNVKELHTRLKVLFGHFEADRIEWGELNAYCMELYLIVIRQGQQPLSAEHLFQVAKFQEFSTLQQIYEFLTLIAQGIATANFDASESKMNSMITSMLNIIKEHIANVDLSLSWIAKELLYMNVDYLGRLFAKETGMKFSQYVLEKRMELAKQLIVGAGDLKVYEISKRTGFTEDAQYFSKVFKKFTGMTPSEFKRMHEDSMEEQID